MNSPDLHMQAASPERMLNLFRELASIVSLDRLLPRIVEIAAELTDRSEEHTSELQSR